MYNQNQISIIDSGERIIPVAEGEISFVFSRHRFAYEYIRQFVANKTVIDVGCGTGYGCKILAHTAQIVYGIDYSVEAIEYCKQHFSSSNIKYLCTNIDSFNLEMRFDVAVSFQVIEHIPDVKNFIDQLINIVKPGGMIFISTPNVRKSAEGKDKNPFHTTEMNYTQFQDLIKNKFSGFDILGVVPASSNVLRDIVGKLHIYKWGKILKRKSKLKKAADRILKLTYFKISKSNLEKTANDFLAICRNDLSL